MASGLGVSSSPDSDSGRDQDGELSSRSLSSPAERTTSRSSDTGPGPRKGALGSLEDSAMGEATLSGNVPRNGSLGSGTDSGPPRVGSGGKNGAGAAAARGTRGSGSGCSADRGAVAVTLAGRFLARVSG